MKRCGWLLALFLFAGCTGHHAFQDAEQALKNKNWDVAVAEYSRALMENPNDPEIQLKLNMAKIFSSRQHYEEATRKLANQQIQDAVVELEIAVNLDPDNSEAVDALTKLRYHIEHPEVPPVAQPAEHPMSELPSVALQPEFQPKSNAPIELKFQDTSLKEVLQTLGKVGDINLLFDKDFSDMPVSFDFTNTTFLQALDTVLTSTHHFFKVIGKNTILIAPDTPAKRTELEETVSRTFYLSNADVEEVARAMRNVLGIQLIATDVRLNAITIKDRITRVLASEKIVAQLDKAKPEVVVDVEILEVNRTRAQQYGLQIHSPGSAGIETSVITKPEELALDPGPIVSRSNFFVTNFPQATFRLLRQSSDTKLLASLPLRTVVGETGRVRFGTQVPVPQTTFAPIATGGVNQQPITSFIYRDVGINIDITPRVHLDGEVTLEVIIESSSISGTGYADLPQFSTSRVEKTIRLKQGETNIIAGLIRDEERRTVTGLPGLSKIPILGPMFSNNDKRIQETDVVIALSPHIVRTLSINPEDEKMLWLGTEQSQQGTATYQTYPPVPSPPTNYQEEPPAEEETPPAEEENPEEVPQDEEQYPQ